MVTRVIWLVGGAAAAIAIGAGASVPLPPPQEPPRQDSFSSSAGVAGVSVIASWQAHGADDGPLARTLPAPLLMPADGAARGGLITQAAPFGDRPSVLDNDWMLDLLVLWRWPGRAPEITQSGGGDAGPAGPFVHRIVVAGGRELRVAFDRRAGAVAVQEAAPVSLGAANVLMLDVATQTVGVAALAAVEPRYAHLADPVEIAIARSADVTAFVGTR